MVFGSSRARGARGVAHEPARAFVAGSSTGDEDGAAAWWTDCSGELFNVRIGPDYAQHGRKAASGEAYYHQVAMDVLQPFPGNVKLDEVARHVVLPTTPAEGPYAAGAPGGPPALPRIIVTNCQVPTSMPGMFGGRSSSGVSVVQYFEIKESTLALLELPEEEQPAAIKLLVRFFKEWETNPDIARRFKAIGWVENMAEVGLPSMFRSFNGKPVIINKMGAKYTGLVDEGNPNDWWFEIDIDVNKFVYLARKFFVSMHKRAPRMELRNAFVIQGEDDEELPETVFACAALRNLDLDKAVSLTGPAPLPAGSDRKAVGAAAAEASEAAPDERAE